MTRRYPLHTLQKIRADEVAGEGRAVAQRVSEREQAERSLEGQRTRRVHEEAEQSQVADGESTRLVEGAATVADLAALGEWRVGATARLVERGRAVERAERRVEGDTEAEARVRRGLAEADARARAVERHRERWQADAERKVAQAEEDEALDNAAARRAR